MLNAHGQTIFRRYFYIVSVRIVLNSKHENLNSIYEGEANSKLSFLDVSVTFAGLQFFLSLENPLSLV